MTLHYSIPSGSYPERPLDSDRLDPRWLFRQGFIPGVEETQEEFKLRIDACLEWSKELEVQTLTIPEYKVNLQPQTRIEQNQLFEDAHIIFKLYGTCPMWVPAYCDSQQLPFLTAGMAVQYLDHPTKQVFTWFQLKPIFRQCKKWLIYSRAEIISHEMCHVCRFPLKSHRYEESLAYKTSTSKFRKQLGGALLGPNDSKVLLLSLFLWMLVDFFSILNLSLPFIVMIAMRSFFPLITAFGLIRNFIIQQELSVVHLKLQKIFGSSGISVLFCLDDQQIKQCLTFSVDELKTWIINNNTTQFNFIKSCFSFIYNTDSKQ